MSETSPSGLQRQLEILRERAAQAKQDRDRHRNTVDEAVSRLKDPLRIADLLLLAASSFTDENFIVTIEDPSGRSLILTVDEPDGPETEEAWTIDELAFLSGEKGYTAALAKRSGKS